MNVCKKSDCFANRLGNCIALNKITWDCRFYKTSSQNESEAKKCNERLDKINFRQLFE